MSKVNLAVGTLTELNSILPLAAVPITAFSAANSARVPVTSVTAVASTPTPVWVSKAVNSEAATAEPLS